MATQVQSTRNVGSFSVNGLATTQVLSSVWLANQIGVGGPGGPGTTGGAFMELFASNGASHGWNSITLGMSSLTGGKTWGVDISLGGAGWFTIGSALANGDFVTVGPQGISLVKSGVATLLAGVRPSAVRLTLSATDTAGIVSVVLEARSI